MSALEGLAASVGLSFYWMDVQTFVASLASIGWIDFDYLNAST
jgi:hypothetical protein